MPSLIITLIKDITSDSLYKKMKNWPSDDKAIIDYYNSLDYKNTQDQSRRNNEKEINDIKKQISVFDFDIDVNERLVPRMQIDIDEYREDLANDLSTEEISTIQRPGRYHGGVEFWDLSKIILSHSKDIGTAVVGLSLVRALKEIIIKWLDNKGKRSVTIQVGTSKKIVINGNIDEMTLSKHIEYIVKILRER